MRRSPLQSCIISRRHLLTNIVTLPAFAGIVLPLTAMKQIALGQDNWRWCHKCEGLWFAGNSTTGSCPSDSQGHSFSGSGNYTLLFSSETSTRGQDNWRWCYKCQGLWFAGHATHGVCPYDSDEHSLWYSGDYLFINNSGQDNWRWCHKCEGLWFAGHSTHGVCPADRREHSRKGSGDYMLA